MSDYLQAFQDCKRKQMAEQGLEWSDDDCVFDKANDKRNNLPDIHLHNLRHTAAIYAHALQRASAKTANVMQNSFEKKEIS